jgi:hypothetical protein
MEKFGRLREALEPRGPAGIAGLAGQGGHPLAAFLVRVMFCMFAEHAGMLRQNAFTEYVEASRSDGGDLASRLGRLFEALDMPPEAGAGRGLLSDELRESEYADGGLFAERLEIPEFDGRARGIILDCAGHGWNSVCPAVFGSLYQSVMDKTRRREIGAHYTGEASVLKLIGPLFLHGLRDELGLAGGSPEKLAGFLAKLSSLRFLDPACGCGNFLTVAYRELRLLELEARMLLHATGKNWLGARLVRNVSADQFSGIELEDFPCRIARAGMRLAERQLDLSAGGSAARYGARPPLKRGANIVCGNALALDWEPALPKSGPAYVFGNPPYSGARIMTRGQKADLGRVFGNMPGLGSLDYVTGWFKKAADCAEGPGVRCAFVSTSSVVQGLQPAILWKPLMESGIRINFGVRSFKWPGEAEGKAAVHCVIIGFSRAASCRELNQYLLKGPAAFLGNRTAPLSGVPELHFGNVPADDGNYLFTRAQRDEFARKEPGAAGLFRPWAGAKEFIGGQERYCLWLGDSPPGELKRMPEVLRRIEAVRRFRLASRRESTRRLAETPTRFLFESLPCRESLAVPRVSSAGRGYVPIGFLPPSVMAGDILLAPGAGLYHFGVLSSGVHMAWVRIVSGRLKSDFRYSIGIVYNNFPWPDPSQKKRAKVERAAKGVLDARQESAGSSLAGLYDQRTMPAGLAAAHRELDGAVAGAYGFRSKAMSDEAVVTCLMQMHRKLAEGGPAAAPEAD